MYIGDFIQKWVLGSFEIIGVVFDGISYFTDFFHDLSNHSHDLGSIGPYTV